MTPALLTATTGEHAHSFCLRVVRSLTSAGLGLALAATPAPARATDLHSVLTGYTLTSFSQKDGLPDASIYALAQDGDGYLWVGTSAGLYRFDGVRFTSWNAVVGSDVTPAPRAVRALHTASDGRMWVGFGAQGGIAVFGERLLQAYDIASGLPSTTVSTILEHPPGNFWAGTSMGLYRLRENKWERWGAPRGVPEGPVSVALVDRRGEMIVATAAQVLRLDERAQRFVPFTPLAEEARAIIEDPSGALMVSDQVAGFRRLGEPLPVDTQIERGRGRALLRDRRDNVWVGTAGQGLWRVRFDDRGDVRFIEHATALTGLLADGVVTLLEDREGNVWAGTPEGLNRLTPYKVAQVTNIGLVSGVEQAGNGALWVGTVDTLLQLSDTDVPVPGPRPLRSERLRALHTDRDGVLWVATDRGLSRWSGRELLPVKTGRGDMPRQIDTITSDGRGGVWVYDAQRGLLHWQGGALVPAHLGDDIAGMRVEAAYTDSGGRAWFAFAGGQVAIADRDKLLVYGRGDGLDAGVYQAVYEDRQHVVWLGGTDGLTRFADGRFVTLRSADGFPVSNLTAIVEDTDGALWIGSGAGIMRIARDECERLLADRAYDAEFRVFDRADGLAGLPFVYSRNRRAIRSQDGRLWFVTGRGLTVIDPRALQTNEASSDVRLEGVLSDGVRLRPEDGLALAAGTNRLELEYTAINLTSPHRQRFRYRLDGFDADWVDAGTRRQAFYTNLPPGTYQFRVATTDANGNWIEPGAVWPFSIRPMFYQTGWFVGSAALLVVLAVGGAWRLHVGRVRKQFGLLLGERARLSRDLHDTLLQSLVGIALQFDAMANDPRFTFSEAQKQQFVRMRRRVEEYMREARQSIADLRAPRTGARDLPVALREAGERAINGHGIHFAFEQRGVPRHVPSRVEQELLQIGKEAIANAVRHGHADRITTELEFTETALALRVIDNGTGFDPAADDEDDTPHYGLTSMRERAEDIGGQLSIESVPGAGTRVEAKVPLRAPRGKTHAEVVHH